MTYRTSTAGLRKRVVMTRADYDARGEQIDLEAGSRFVRGNVTLKQGYMFTPSKFERERAEVLTKAGIKFKKN